MTVTDYVRGDLISLVVTFFVLLICYWKWSYQYWRRRNVPYLEPQIPFGNMTKTFRGKENLAVTLEKIYVEVKNKSWKHAGIYIFNKPCYFVTDLNIIRNIMTKDFDYFADRSVYFNKKDRLHDHPFNLTGRKWKNRRAQLSPTFTSGKMKMMFPVMVECQNDLQNRMHQECLKNKPIDIKALLASFAINVTGSCVFGIECKALEDENSPFRIWGKKNCDLTPIVKFKQMFCTFFPELAKFLDISYERHDVADFCTNMVQEGIEHREKNNYTRNDFLQLLINLKNENGDHNEEPFTMDTLVAQCFAFFGVGFETSSALMTFALYQLAKHQHIQDKLRRDIKAILVNHNNQITYESIQEMTYLTQVIDETLRMHPPGAIINRKCSKDYKVPGENFIIEKGTTVMISMLGIHYDEDYYSSPKNFDPDRFSEENKQLRHKYAYLPFGAGPRSCIAMRFGLLESKIGLIVLLKDYKFTLNEKTEEPIVYRPGNTLLVVQGDVWLNAQKI